jgi:hypothetical protein
MQNHDWIELFRLIPEDQHNCLVLTTRGGEYLSIDTILRTELSYLVFRGRVRGQTDEGRVFFLPYQQIDFLQINRIVAEAEIRELYGEPLSGGSSIQSPGSGVTVMAGPKSAIVGPGSSVAGAPVAAGSSLHPASISRAGTAGGRPSNVPAAALRPAANSAAAAPGDNGNASAPAQRNSILERLRAQRNAAVPPRPQTK